MTDGLVPSIAKRGGKPYDRKLSPLKISLTSNPQLIGLSAFFACKARNNHLVAHVLVQQKRLRHKSPLPHKAT